MTDWEKIVAQTFSPEGITLSEWVGLYGPESKEKSVTFGSPIETFIAKYQISELGSSQVAIMLPAGTSRIEFLKEAQWLSGALHASNPEQYLSERAVSLNMIRAWESESRFFKQVERSLSLRIDGNVEGSTSQTRLEQVNKGWNDVTFQDLAVAHTAFYLLTGKDLFEGNVVRAASGALSSGRGEGLVEFGSQSDDRYSNISASRYL